MSLRMSLFVGLLLLLSVGIVSAQDDAAVEACPALVEQALAELGDNCGEMGRNAACYGYNQVDSSFNVEVADDYFNDPADRAELVELNTIRTAPLDLEQERWGIAVMNVQANVPGTVPGQAVTFLLLGDSQVTNTVDAADVTPEVEPVTVTTAVNANIRSGPGLDNNVVIGARAGTSMPADAINAEGTWARVYYNDRLAWISFEVLQSTDGLDELPVSTDPVVSPMQAFYFTTGIGQPQCSEAPDVIGIRSPEGIEVALNANGANFTIGSTIALKYLGDNLFAITVLEGELNTEDGQTVPAGQTIVGLLGDDGNWIEWVEIRDATEEELGYEPTINAALEALGIVDTTPTPPPNTGVSCPGFQPTSPLLGLAYGNNAFYWDAAQGADAYRVTVFNLTEGPTLAFDVPGSQTFGSANLTQETIGGGFNFAWRVEALRNGRVICTSRTVELPREAPTVAGPGPSVAWTCAGPAQYSTIFSWNNIPSGQTVTFYYNQGGTPTSAGPFTGTSGSMQVYTAAQTVDSGYAITSGGANLPLPGSLTCL